MPSPPTDFPFEVVVPASTSNLGPGFDFLGLALSLELRVRLLGTSGREEHRIVRCDGTAGDWPESGRNVLFEAFDLARARLGAPPQAMLFEVASEIPIARGLGSSGAAIAAGLLLGSRLAPRAATSDELLEWGLALEGHPDNVCAALLGGCTLSVPLGDGRVRVVRQAVAPELGFALAWPATRSPTSEARRVLPKTVAFADAIENPRRLALLLEGLRTGDEELLRLGVEDRLHSAYRLPLIPGGEAALRAAYEAGAYAAAISGSGSALVAIGARARRQEIADAMASALEAVHPGAESRVVDIVAGGPRVIGA